MTVVALLKREWKSIFRFFSIKAIPISACLPFHSSLLRCFMATLTAPHLCRTSCGHQSWHVTSASFPSDGTHASLCAWSCCSAWTNAPELLLLLSPRPRPKTSSSPKPPPSECVVRYCIHRFGPHPATRIKPQEIFCLTYVISLKYLFDMLIEPSLTPLSIVCVKTVSVWGLSFGEFIIDCSICNEMA